MRQTATDGATRAQARQQWSVRRSQGCAGALAALGTKLDADELFELERNYTPCDLINDYTAGKRIAREARLAQGTFVEQLEKAA